MTDPTKTLAQLDVIVSTPRVITAVVQPQPPPLVAAIATAGRTSPSVTNASYLHNQAVPSDVWTINHNLGFKPLVQVYTLGGVEVDAEVQHLNSNQVRVSFVIPLAGTARLV
ncbi:hypothetical protein [Deinococcus pimensis]|uniref:hypothetical protein n=1 Tax=Deinococcus pimensis TaxID=309888 RepID=UPI0004842EE6|nr:hypothetical protein [Deinococcus pimensis]